MPEASGVRLWMWRLPEEGEIVPDYPPVELTDVVVTSMTIHITKDDDDD